MTRFVAGLTILGSERGAAEEGRREPDEKHRHQIPEHHHLIRETSV